MFICLEKKELAVWKEEKGEIRKGETGRVFVLRLMLMAIECLTKSSLLIRSLKLNYYGLVHRFH